MNRIGLYKMDLTGDVSMMGLAGGDGRYALFFCVQPGSFLAVDCSVICGSGFTAINWVLFSGIVRTGVFPRYERSNLTMVLPISCPHLVKDCW